MSSKQMILERVQELPDTFSVSQIAEEVQILAAIREGEKAADAGLTKTHDEVKQLLEEWTAK